MKNPLWKRLPRELKSDFGKYIVIFLFMTLTIGFVSGFLVADDSMLAAYDEGFEKYNIEHGNFTLSSKASESDLKKIEKNGNVKFPTKSENNLKYVLQTVKNHPSRLLFSQNILNLSQNKSKVFQAS